MKDRLRQHTVVLSTSDPALMSAVEQIGCFPVAPQTGSELSTVISEFCPRLVIVHSLAECRTVRARSDAAIAMIAPNDPDVVVAGFECGADDVIDPLCHRDVLRVRLQALMRRGHLVERGIIEIAGITVDPSAAQVYRDGVPVAMTPTEYRLLVHFVERPGVVRTRDDLVRAVWGYSWRGESRLVDVHIARLRAKVGERLLETVRGQGYRFAAS